MPDHPEAEKAVAWIGARYEIEQPDEVPAATRAELYHASVAAKSVRVQKAKMAPTLLEQERDHASSDSGGAELAATP